MAFDPLLLRDGSLLAVASLLLACSDDPPSRDNARPTELGVLAAGELRFARTLVAPYTGTDYAPAARIGKSSEAFHRGVCMDAFVQLADARASKAPVDASHRAVALLRAQLPVFFASVPNEQFTKPASGSICLMAVHLAGEALAPAERAPLESAFVELAGYVMKERNASWYGVGIWGGDKPDARNSQAEELGFTASFLVAAAKLLPPQIDADGGDLRDAWMEEAGRMVSLSHRACSVEVATEDQPACPFAACSDSADPECVGGRRWLVANHGMTPHPIYTASLMTSYAEIAMIHQQRGEALPAWLPGPPIIDPMIAAIGARLRSGADATPDHRAFSVLGSLEHTTDEGEVTTLMYPDLEYTLRNHLPPVTRLDAFSTAYDSALGETRGYIVRGDGIWHYRCGAGGCRPIYAEPLSTLWNGATWTQTPPFSVDLPTSAVESLSQFYRRAGEDERLGTLVKSGDRLWYYECFQSGEPATPACEPCYTRKIADQLATVACPAEQSCTTPPGDADVSVTYDNYLDKLRVYLTSGDRIWHYRCESQGACAIDACEWVYTGALLSDLWGSVEDAEARFRDAAGTYQELPPDGIDALTQAYRTNSGDAADVLATYVVSGNRMWHYTCAYEPGSDKPRCRAQYTKTLAQTWAAVSSGDTFERWPVPPKQAWNADLELRIDRGVVDWGFDGTVQNSAWAAAQRLGSTGAIDTRYAALQAEQIERFDGCTTTDCKRAWLPPSFQDGSTGLVWSFGALPTLAEADVISPLTDGWGVRADQDVKVNTHWFFNMLAGYNHAVAWMLLDPEAKLLLAD